MKCMPDQYFPQQNFFHLFDFLIPHWRVLDMPEGNTRNFCQEISYFLRRLDVRVVQGLSILSDKWNTSQWLDLPAFDELAVHSNKLGWHAGLGVCVLRGRLLEEGFPVRWWQRLRLLRFRGGLLWFGLGFWLRFLLLDFCFHLFTTLLELDVCVGLLFLYIFTILFIFTTLILLFHIILFPCLIPNLPKLLILPTNHQINLFIALNLLLYPQLLHINLFLLPFIIIFCLVIILLNITVTFKLIVYFFIYCIELKLLSRFLLHKWTIRCWSQHLLLGFCYIIEIY